MCQLMLTAIKIGYANKSNNERARKKRGNDRTGLKVYKAFLILLRVVVLATNIVCINPYDKSQNES